MDIMSQCAYVMNDISLQRSRGLEYDASGDRSSETLHDFLIKFTVQECRKTRLRKP